MPTIVIAIIIAALVTLGILLTGVVNMARGKDVTGQTSNKLMQARVVAQGVTVLLIVIFVVMMAKN